jgi:hypothetical protein
VVIYWRSANSLYGTENLAPFKSKKMYSEKHDRRHSANRVRRMVSVVMIQSKILKYCHKREFKA